MNNILSQKSYRHKKISFGQSLNEEITQNHSWKQQEREEIGTPQQSYPRAVSIVAEQRTGENRVSVGEIESIPVAGFIIHIQYPQEIKGRRSVIIRMQ